MHKLIDELTAAWNSHEITRLLALYAPDYEGEDVAMAQYQHGHDDVARLVTAYWDAFPDLTLQEIDRVIGDGRASVRWIARGTHLGRLLNIPPTHRMIAAHSISMMTIEHGLIVRGAYLWDMACVLRTLHLLPDLPPPT